MGPAKTQSLGEVDSRNFTECSLGVWQGSNLCSSPQGQLEQLGTRNVLYERA